jgi:hypothetical protein
MKTLALVALVLGSCFAADRLVNPSPPTAADAIIRSDARSLRRFLDRGTPVDASDARGNSLLAIAVSMQDSDTAGLLLDRGADPNHVDDLGRTPLHVAAMLNEGSMVRLLVARGADVNRATPHGLTPLLLATQGWVGRSGSVAARLRREPQRSLRRRNHAAARCGSIRQRRRGGGITRSRRECRSRKRRRRDPHGQCPTRRRCSDDRGPRNRRFFVG